MKIRLTETQLRRIIRNVMIENRNRRIQESRRAQMDEGLSDFFTKTKDFFRGAKGRQADIKGILDVMSEIAKRCKGKRAFNSGMDSKGDTGLKDASGQIVTDPEKAKTIVFNYWFSASIAGKDAGGKIWLYFDTKKNSGDLRITFPRMFSDGDVASRDGKPKMITVKIENAPPSQILAGLKTDKLVENWVEAVEGATLLQQKGMEAYMRKEKEERDEKDRKYYADQERKERERGPTRYDDDYESENKKDTSSWGSRADLGGPQLDPYGRSGASAAW